ncbi:MAG: SRPBCC domain-containing protein [Pyrinomonadaceae bacterium]|nr:SRPBCC domain-containing protein [Pyrinomonadaceae bacterium]
MERKTNIDAEDGRQDILITREFDLPIESLFRAHVEANLVEQWMGTKVIKLENKKHGSYEFETSDQNGNVLFRANGTIHDFAPNERITRTFEMENTPFPVQLEFLEFSGLSDARSKLTIQMVFRSVEDRDNLLKLPFRQGINMAHDRLQEIVGKLRQGQ